MTAAEAVKIPPAIRENVSYRLFSKLNIGLLVGVIVYVLTLPAAIKLNGGQIPQLYSPLISVLESPLAEPLKWYLRLWGISVDYLRTNAG